MCYVYRFLNKKDIVIYVGKTGNIDNRISQHFGSGGHLSEKCYDSVDVIEYLKLPSKIDMDIKELYYINKWKPLYNQKDKQDAVLELVIDENKDNWKVFKGKTTRHIERIEKELERLNEQLNKLKCAKTLLNNKYNIAKAKIDELKGVIKAKDILSDNIENIEFEHEKSRKYSLSEIKKDYKDGDIFIGSMKVNDKPKYNFMAYVSNKRLHIKEVSATVLNSAPLNNNIIDEVLDYDWKYAETNGVPPKGYYEFMMALSCMEGSFVKVEPRKGLIA